MQKLIVALSFVTCSTVFAQNTQPVEYEVIPGCISNTKSAQCVVANRYTADITCTLHITIKTEKGRTIGNSKTVQIPAGKFTTLDAFPAAGDAVKEVSSTASCKTQ